MISLSVDTSTPLLSIALTTDTTREERFISGRFSPSENLLPVIREMAGRAGIELRDIELLICTKGPGSFTGLRIAMSSLKGIASASDAALVSVPTLSVIEDTVSDLWNGPVLSVIDAKKKKFYYRLSENGRTIVPDTDGTPEDLVPVLEKMEGTVLVTGPDSAIFTEKLFSISPSLPIRADREEKRNLAPALERLGKKLLISRGPDDIGEGPVYIRKSDAEEMLLAAMAAKEGKE